MFGFLKTNHEARRDEVQAEFVARVAAAAQEFVQAAGPDGVGLDYTPGSIHALDAALEAAHVGALALTPMQTVGAAAYLYEVRREHGGLYEVCDDEDPVVLVCGESGAQVAWPPSPRSSGASVTGRPRPSRLTSNVSSRPCMPASP